MLGRVLNVPPIHNDELIRQNYVVLSVTISEKHMSCELGKLSELFQDLWNFPKLYYR